MLLLKQYFIVPIFAKYYFIPQRFRPKDPSLTYILLGINGGWGYWVCDNYHYSSISLLVTWGFLNNVYFELFDLSFKYKHLIFLILYIHARNFGFVLWLSQHLLC